MKKYLLPSLLIIPTTLVTIFIESLYSWLTGEYLNDLHKVISYKLLLQICLFLLAGIIALIYIVLQKDSKNIIPQNKNKASQSLQKSEKDILEERIRLLKNLSGDEKGVLKSYFKKDTKSQIYDVSDGIVAGLARKEILFHATSYGFGDEMSCNIEEWAWEYLKEHPQLLD
jgi:hypothetical protein